MKRKAFSILLIILAILLLSPLSAHAAQGTQAEVLLVYSTKPQHDQLLSLIEACGKNVEAVHENDYKSGMALSCEYVVTTSQKPLEDAAQAGITPLCVGDAFESVPSVELILRTDLQISVQYDGYSQPAVFEEKATLIGSYDGEPFGRIVQSTGAESPFAVFSDSMVCVPYVGSQDLSAIMLGGVMQSYFGHSLHGKMYVLIDEIYPFSDFNMLCSAADKLQESAIPFMLRIMPVYDNLDYPAFLRYAQVLRYVQSRGGTIILHDPLVRDEMEREPLEDKLERLHDTLAEQNVDLFDLHTPPYLLSLDAVTQIKSGNKNLGELPIDTMIVLSLPKDLNELNDVTGRLNDAWLSIADYKRQFSEKNYRYDEEAVDAQYVYVEAETLSFTSFFAAGNEMLLVVVSLCLALFVVLITLGIRLYRQKFRRRNLI